jgi:hypothetical protein
MLGHHLPVRTTLLALLSICATVTNPAHAQGPAEGARSPHEDVPHLAIDSPRDNIIGEAIGDSSWDPLLIINTDRPDFTDVLITVGDGVWQLESGYSFKRHREPGANYSRHQLPEGQMRLGVGKRFEFRVRFDGYLLPDATWRPGAERTNVLGADSTVGFKWVAFEQQNWIPQLTLMGLLAYRYADPDLVVSGLQPGLNAIYGWQINKWLVFRASTGLEFMRKQRIEPKADGTPGDDGPVRSTPEIRQSLVAYWQIAKRLGAYTEWFASFTRGDVHEDQHNVGVGLYIYLTPNVQLDLRYGGTVSGAVKDEFMGIGFSTRGHMFQSTPAPGH